VTNTAEASLSELERGFPGVLAGIPSEAKTARAGGHAFGIAFEFDRGGVDVAHIVGLSTVGVPGQIPWAIIGESLERLGTDCINLIVSRI
jgi:hypothetical protein